MADKKISQLTAATTPLAGTEVLPIVQGGTTVKATVNNVLAPIQVTTTRAGINTAPTFSFHILGSGEFGGLLAQSNVAGATSFTLQQGVTGVSNSGVSLRNADSAYDWLRFTAVGGDVSVQTGNLVIGTAGKGIDFSANTGTAGMTSQLLDDYEEGTWTPNQGPGLTVIGAFSSNGTYTKIGRCVTVRGQLIGATSIACASGGALVTNLPFTVFGSAAGAVGNGNVNQGSTAIAYNVQVYLMTTITASASIDFTVTYFV